MVYTTRIRFFAKGLAPHKYRGWQDGNTPGAAYREAYRTCKVYDMSDQSKALAFGRTDIDAKTVIHQGRTPCSCTHMDIGDIPYVIVSRREVRNKTAYTVQRVLV